MIFPPLSAGPTITAPPPQFPIPPPRGGGSGEGHPEDPPTQPPHTTTLKRSLVRKTHTESFMKRGKHSHTAADLPVDFGDDLVRHPAEVVLNQGVSSKPLVGGLRGGFFLTPPPRGRGQPPPPPVARAPILKQKNLRGDSIRKNS